MNSFRTVLPQETSQFKISHRDCLLMIGSCFTENIGKRLSERKFNILINPFGIVYNPVSMASCLERLLSPAPLFQEHELFQYAGLWHSREHHGRFSRPDRAETLAGINEACEAAAQQLKSCNRLLLTLGTADVFYLKEPGRVVANNHKMPAAHFQERRVSFQEIADTFRPLLERLFHLNPELQVIFSVSPVRHTRNGLIHNQLSKSSLLLACDALCAEFPQVHYFPAYELLLDDLRDYRFYASDMLHPSEVAVDYIWNYFSDMYFTEETRKLNLAVEKILAALNHRPFNPDSEEYREFIAKQREAWKQLGFE